MWWISGTSSELSTPGRQRPLVRCTGVHRAPPFPVTVLRRSAGVDRRVHAFREVADLAAVRLGIDDVA
jgi:hypothetical protein